LSGEQRLPACYLRQLAANHESFGTIPIRAAREDAFGTAAECCRQAACAPQRFARARVYPARDHAGSAYSRNDGAGDLSLRTSKCDGNAGVVGNGSGAARYDGLRELLTQQLQSLPPGAGALTGEPLKIEGHDRDELTWFCSAGPGVLTRYASGDYRVNLRLRRHDAKSQQLDLGLLRTPKDDTAVSNEHETWVRLIDNVATLQIRFFDSRLNTWVQRWTDTVTLPRLVKVVIGRTDAKVPTEIIVPLARMPL
jgi:Pseudopilin GspJ.